MVQLLGGEASDLTRRLKQQIASAKPSRFKLKYMKSEVGGLSDFLLRCSKRARYVSGLRGVGARAVALLDAFRP